MEDKSIYDVALELKLDKNFEWDDWSTMMTFGMCAYTTTIIVTGKQIGRAHV